MASGLASFNARRNVRAPAMMVSTIQGSTITTASITATAITMSTLTGSTISAPSISVSSLTGSTITSNMLSLSTLTVSSINASSINTSSITTSSITTASGYNSNISNVIYTSLADSGQTAASFTAASLPATAPAGSVISGSYRLTAGASSGAAVMRLSSYTFVVGTTYNFTFTGTQGSQALALYVYQYNSAGTASTQISASVYSITTSATTVSGSFTPNASGTYTGTIVFYFQAAAVNQYVNFTAFSMTVGSMNVGIGMSNPIAKLQINQDGNSTANEVGTHSMGILSNQGTSGTNLMYMMLDADYTNQCCSIQSIIYGLTVWNLNLNPRGGNVGIGTTNPGAILHVHDSLTTATSIPLMLFSPNLSTGGAQYMYFGTANSANNSAQIGWTNVGAGSASNYAFLQIYGKANIMTWQASTGNVGIGTTNPTASLHVVTSTTATTSGILSGRYYLSSPGDNQDASGTDFDGPWYGLGWSGIAGLSGNPYVCLAGFAGVAMRSSSGFIQLTGAGNVGIGTTSPGSLLHVNGGNITVNYGSMICLHASYPTGGSYSIGGAGNNLRIALNSDASTNRLLDIGYYTGDVSSGTWNSKMVVNPISGNVGIGITNPNKKLYVSENNTLPTITSAQDLPAQFVLQSNSAWLKMGQYYQGGVGSWGIIQSSDYYSSAEHGVNLGLNPLDGRVSVGGQEMSGTATRNPGGAMSRFTIHSDYSDSNSGFAINASDGTTDNYYMKLYPYVVSGGVVGYNFLTYNASTSYSPLSFNRNLVGINNTSPSYPLDVTGQLRVLNGSMLVQNGNDSFTYYGPNTTWSATLAVGSGTEKGVCQVFCTDGNLHLDCLAAKSIYIGYHNSCPINIFNYTRGAGAGDGVITNYTRYFRQYGAIDADSHAYFQNTNGGSNAYFNLIIASNAGNTNHFINSTTRSPDGGIKAYTIRNDTNGGVRFMSNYGGFSSYGYDGSGGANTCNAVVNYTNATTANIGSWSAQGFTLFCNTSQPAGNQAALGLGSNNSTANFITSLSPGVRWMDLYLSAATIAFYMNGSPVGYTVSSGGANVSDEREKLDINDLSTATSLRRVMRCRPKYYKRKHYDCDKDGTPLTPAPQSQIDQIHIGLLAQDMFDINPHCLSTWQNKYIPETDEDDGTRYGICYNDWIVHLIGSVQQQQCVIEAANTQITTLQTANTTLNGTCAALQQENVELKSQVSTLSASMAGLSASYASLLARLEALEAR